MARAKAKPKFTSHEDTLESAVGGAFSEIEELAGEFREMVDNAPENLHGSSLYETRESTADTLENLSAPDVPDALGEIGVTYTQAAGRGKRGAMSRATRAENAASILSACVDAVREWVESNPLPEEDEKESDEDKTKREELEEAHEGADTLIDELEEAASEVENAEYPGMFG